MGVCIQGVLCYTGDNERKNGRIGEEKQMPDTKKDLDIERIRHMERLYDALRAAAETGRMDDAVRETARELEAYYTGGQWLCDYERDEKGSWPKDLKRGVLSEDGLYDLLAQADEAMNRAQ